MASQCSWPRDVSAAAVRMYGPSDLEEAMDVGPKHVVPGLAILGGGFRTIFVDRRHDVVEFLVHFLAGPIHSLRVLRHLQAGACDATGVCGLARAVERLGLDESGDGSGVDGMFAPSDTTVQPFLRRFFASSPLISFCVALGKAQSHLMAQRGLALPSPSGVKVLPGNAFAYSLMRPGFTFFRSKTKSSFFFVYALGIVNVALGVGERND